MNFVFEKPAKDGNPFNSKKQSKSFDTYKLALEYLETINSKGKDSTRKWFISTIN